MGSGAMMKKKISKSYGSGSKQGAKMKASTAKEERGERIPDAGKEKKEKLFDGAGRPMTKAQHQKMYSFH